jgi:Fe-S cluster assembly protein SufD
MTITPEHATESPTAAGFPVPTGREEQWRFTPLEPLRGLLAGDQQVDDAPLVTWTTEAAEVREISADDPRVGSVLTPIDRISANVADHADKVLAIEVPKEAEAKVNVVVDGQGGVSYARTLIDVGADARAIIVLDHVGSGAYAGDVEVLVGQGAKVHLISVQEWQDDAVHASHHHARVGRDASFTSVVVTMGGALVRITPTVTYEGPGGDAELYGLYFADAGQHQEHRLFVDHEAPHCRSRVMYKGALQGDAAHSVWVGDVLIRASAVGTDTYELNRNLVLTDGARADSVPNLEIETGDVVGAGHASATGRFDDEQLFYLQSRGIDKDTARRLVVLGFFADVLDKIPDSALRDRLLQAVETELGYTRDDVESGSADE